jgi:UDPglucose--hexose-1-phosphate uridylyltransferase
MINFSEHPHRRYNQLTGEWVLVSPHRAKRPWQGQTEKPAINQRPSYDPTCYLCPGNQRAQGPVNDKYTSTFVFTNDFSALLPDTPVGEMNDGMLIAKSEQGVSRVICFSPNHALTIPEMDLPDIKNVVDLWCNEYMTLGAKDFINHVQIFENKGAVMGCSNPHPHGQIWAQSSIPVEVQKEIEQQKAFYQKHKKTLLSHYLEQEFEKQERIVAENDTFVCLVPFWAVWPFETMILPKRAVISISELTEQEKMDFAAMYQTLTIKYDNLFQTSFPYSAGIHQAPTDGAEHPEWHMHMHFYPPLLRSASVKKFMVGYEMMANAQRDITAEQSAQRLRDLSTLHFKKQ